MVPLQDTRTIPTLYTPTIHHTFNSPLIHRHIHPDLCLPWETSIPLSWCECTRCTAVGAGSSEMEEVIIYSYKQIIEQINQSQTLIASKAHKKTQLWVALRVAQWMWLVNSFAPSLLTGMFSWERETWRQVINPAAAVYNTMHPWRYVGAVLWFVAFIGRCDLSPRIERSAPAKFVYILSGRPHGQQQPPPEASSLSSSSAAAGCSRVCVAPRHPGAWIPPSSCCLWCIRVVL